MADITSHIMDDHEWFRRQFARLDDAAGVAELNALWTPLAARLDTHAEAEETIFYPRLLKRGDDAEEETDDAIRDHNKIRDAVADSRKHAVGGPEWFAAVGRARHENTEHIGEEEDEGLPDFRKNAPMQLREQLGEEWLRFYAAHHGGRGISGEDVDPDEYIAENS
ncbi:hemerythrin domain-containing protein [Jatrophihabitans sp. DSM 45814]